VEDFKQRLLGLDPDAKILIPLERSDTKAYGTYAKITVTCKSVEPSEARKKKELAAKEAYRAENSVPVANQRHGSTARVSSCSFTIRLYATLDDRYDTGVVRWGTSHRAARDPCHEHSGPRRVSPS
jgi:hypothetical protein